MCLDCCLSTLSNSAGSATTCILERVWNPIERQISYLVRYTSNLKTLRERAAQLNATKRDVLTSVDHAKDKGEEIKDEVLNWHVETVQIELDVEHLEEEIEKRNGCCHKWHLDWRNRHRISRLAKKKTDDIDLHLPKGKFDSISFPARHADLRSLPTSDFVPVESSLRALNSIIQVLKDETNNNNIIGVHGSGGIGKTTLMKQLVKRVDQEIPFDKVILANITQTPNLRRIQDEIAKLLGFEIEGDIQNQRAATLCERLKQRQRVLIILDDLWERLDLAAVGIPYGEEHKGCKIIVTSRVVEVCNEMESSKNIPIEELTDKDRLDLFKIKAGISDSNAFDLAAEEVVRQCGKLPNSIVTIGRALRNKPVKEWNDAIKKTKESNVISVEGIPEEVVLCVTLGYNQLEKVDKACLQFSCLFPPYYSVSVEEFVKYGLVDKVFPNVIPNVDSLGEVWKLMHPVVEKLNSSNLLLEGDRESCYRIHDDTRKVVKYIASKEGYHILAEAGLQKGWPKAELQKCEKLSLMDSNVAELPVRPECPRLLTLFLQNNALEDIPILFFDNMRALEFLNLSYTNISSLPMSLQCLGKLRLLHLESTHLRDATSVKECHELEIFILKGSSIEQLPIGLEKMTNLKLLDLSNNLFLKGIPANVISKLCQLEELYVGNSFGDWEVEGIRNSFSNSEVKEIESSSSDLEPERNIKQRNATFSEVASLRRLTVLYIHVKNTKVLSIDFDGPWKNLKRFRICVNDDYWEIASTRSMHLKNLSKNLANWIKLLLEKAEYLTITRSTDIEHSGQIDLHGLTGLMCLHLRACSMHRLFLSSLQPRVENLEELHVEYCYSLKEVFCFEEIEEERAGFTKLRELTLVGLPKLLIIWKGNRSAAQLKSLKLMKVKECGKLRNLFPKTLASRLHALEQLTILKCDHLEEIVSTDEAEVEQEAEPNTKFSNVPQPMFFQNLQKLIISKCNKMKGVLSLTIAQGLNQLQELTVVSCSKMEAIISVTFEEREAENDNFLPTLKILALQELQNLDSLYNGETVLNLPSLQELKVWECPKLKQLPLASSSAPNLRKFTAQSTWFEGLQWNNEYSKIRLKTFLAEEE